MSSSSLFWRSLRRDTLKYEYLSFYLFGNLFCKKLDSDVF
nr:MAG TPA: hypothetical protein [Caudoviricetes sp.]